MRRSPICPKIQRRRSSLICRWSATKLRPSGVMRTITRRRFSGSTVRVAQPFFSSAARIAEIRPGLFPVVSARWPGVHAPWAASSRITAGSPRWTRFMCSIMAEWLPDMMVCMRSSASSSNATASSFLVSGIAAISPDCLYSSYFTVSNIYSAKCSGRKSLEIRRPVPAPDTGIERRGQVSPREDWLTQRGTRRPKPTNPAAHTRLCEEPLAQRAPDAAATPGIGDRRLHPPGGDAAERQRKIYAAWPSGDTDCALTISSSAR